jgi:cytochrome c peroxidase
MLKHMRRATLLALGLAGPVLAATDDTALLARAGQLFAPLPTHAGSVEHPVSPERVALGRALFFEPRVSLDGTASCARCHQPALHGTDALPKSIGAAGRVNARNAPTVLNAAVQFTEHWVGDRTDVEDQARRALLGPASFGNPDFAAAMAKLRGIPGYAARFREAFPGEADPITPENWAAALGAYERTLLTPAPFDAYLKGDIEALTPAARDGLAQFIDTGCAGCHSGVGVGGGSFQKFGVVEDYWKATGSEPTDPGRFAVTGQVADRYVFKVPSLRNVAMTAPYFHDGSVATLPQAVRVMARVQLGKMLSDGEVEAIVAFLGSLTGPLPADFATAPVLPAAGFRP